MHDIIGYVDRVKQLNPEIKVRASNLSDGDKFVSLFNTYYHRKTNIAYFTWQFFDTPCLSKLFVAYDNELLIGFFGVKKYPLTGKINTGFVVDFLIHELYRKRGIGYLLAAEVEKFCLENDIFVLTGLPNSFGNAALKAMGWQSVAKIDTLINDNIDTFGVDVTIPDVRIDPSLIEFNRNDEFIKWRFDAHPVYKYEKVIVDKDNYAVTKIFDDPVTGNSFLDIVDIQFSNRLDLLQDLLKKVKFNLSGKKIQSITIWALPHTKLFQYLMKTGFKILPQSRFFCVKLLVENYCYLTDIDKWNLMEMNSEIY
jgi:GNAT superfamily N-acetyltransferase